MINSSNDNNKITTLSFNLYSDGEFMDDISISRTIKDDVVCAVELANFFSSVSRAVGYNSDGVTIRWGDTDHASDY